MTDQDRSVMVRIVFADGSAKIGGLPTVIATDGMEYLPSSFITAHPVRIENVRVNAEIGRARFYREVEWA